jgi:hypothetical protein
VRPLGLEMSFKVYISDPATIANVTDQRHDNRCPGCTIQGTQEGANVTGTLGVSGVSTTNTILPITDADLGSNDARWNTTYSRNVRLDLAEIQGQADGNLVLIADSGDSSQDRCRKAIRKLDWERRNRYVW